MAIDDEKTDAQHLENRSGATTSRNASERGQGEEMGPLVEFDSIEQTRT